MLQLCPNLDFGMEKNEREKRPSFRKYTWKIIFYCLSFLFISPTSKQNALSLANIIKPVLDEVTCILSLHKLLFKTWNHMDPSMEFHYLEKIVSDLILFGPTTTADFGSTSNRICRVFGALGHHPHHWNRYQPSKEPWSCCCLPQESCLGSPRAWLITLYTILFIHLNLYEACLFGS